MRYVNVTIDSWVIALHTDIKLETMTMYLEIKLMIVQISLRWDAIVKTEPVGCHFIDD